MATPPENMPNRVPSPHPLSPPPSRNIHTNIPIITNPSTNSIRAQQYRQIWPDTTSAKDTLTFAGKTDVVDASALMAAHRNVVWALRRPTDMMVSGSADQLADPAACCRFLNRSPSRVSIQTLPSSAPQIYKTSTHSSDDSATPEAPSARRDDEKQHGSPRAASGVLKQSCTRRKDSDRLQRAPTSYPP